MSRADFAKRIGIHLNTLGYYERSQRTPDAIVLISICKEFAIKPLWLLLGEGDALDKDRITIEQARAGSLCAGQHIRDFVVNNDVDIRRRDGRNSEKLFSQTVIQNAIIAVEQALAESNKQLAPQKKAALIIVACELLVDMNDTASSEKILKLIRLSA
jgi:transcriptional regulator with XRE-family HTH domain